jgi:hypothetical protein
MDGKMWAGRSKNKAFVEEGRTIRIPEPGKISIPLLRGNNLLGLLFLQWIPATGREIR